MNYNVEERHKRLIKKDTDEKIAELESSNGSQDGDGY